jgi:hypothetical protein
LSDFSDSNINIDDEPEIRSDASEEEVEAELAKLKLSAEDISFVITTMKKEAEYDLLSLKQLFYAMASAFTKVPVHHIVNSKEAGAGKNYLLNLVSRYFPNQYVLPLSGMSDKALFHRKGELVIQDKQTGQLVPIEPVINDLKDEIEELEDDIQLELGKDPKTRNKKVVKENKKRIRELESEIKDTEYNAQKLIQLNNQIIMCLDTPQLTVYDALMSIISQDTERDQQYSFVDKSGSGKLGTRDNILKGTPLLLTSQVIDDTKTSRFQEKNRRLINVNPDTSHEKISAANNIIGLKGGYLPEEYDGLVVSRLDKERAKQIVAILVAKLKLHSKSLEQKEYGVKIPFALSVTNSVPNNQVWGMTVADRTIKYLATITKVHMDARPRIVNDETGQFWPIATFEDLREALFLMQVGATGIRPYVVTWYNQVFLPCFNSLGGIPYKDIVVGDDGKVITIAEEKHVGVNTEQLAEKTKDVLGGSKLGSKELHGKYIYPLINQGVLEEVQSEIDKRRNIYFPLDEGSIFSVFEDLHVKVSNPSIFPSKTFLKEQLRILSKYSPQGGVENNEKNFSHYRLIDVDGTEITVDHLLDQYFSEPEDCFIKSYSEAEPTNTEEKNQKNIPHPVATILTELPNNGIEDFPYPFPSVDVLQCNYCEFQNANRYEYDKHTAIRHSNKAGYPDRNGRTK